MRTSLSSSVKFAKVIVNELSTDFAKCTKVVKAELSPSSIRPTEVIVKNAYAGVNASDINFSAGVYKPGVNPPFDAGFEGLGEVVAVGERAAKEGYEIGDSVQFYNFGAFSEYQVVPSRAMHKVKSLDPKWLPLEVSGVTAYLALQYVGAPILKGETALVTAAAGGTGMFASQLLKKVYGCGKVYGTCSNDAKADFLKERLGIDRPVNIKKENLSEVLGSSTAVNICYESVGGPLFETCANHLSIRGKLITIGSMSGYKDGSSFGKNVASTPSSSSTGGVPINTVLLQKSASLRGFFLPHFAKYQREAFARLEELVEEGTILSVVDEQKSFVGIEDVVPAVEHLQSGANIGKVVVKL